MGLEVLTARGMGGTGVEELGDAIEALGLPGDDVGGRTIVGRDGEPIAPLLHALRQELPEHSAGRSAARVGRREHAVVHGPEEVAPLRGLVALRLVALAELREHHGLVQKVPRVLDVHIDPHLQEAQLRVLARLRQPAHSRLDPLAPPPHSSFSPIQFFHSAPLLLLSSVSSSGLGCIEPRVSARDNLTPPSSFYYSAFSR